MCFSCNTRLHQQGGESLNIAREGSKLFKTKDAQIQMFHPALLPGVLFWLSSSWSQSSISGLVCTALSSGHYLSLLLMFSPPPYPVLYREKHWKGRQESWVLSFISWYVFALKSITQFFWAHTVRVCNNWSQDPIQLKGSNYERIWFKIGENMSLLICCLSGRACVPLVGSKFKRWEIGLVV